MKAGWTWRPMTRADITTVCELEQAACRHPIHAWNADNYASSLGSGYWMRVLCTPDQEIAGVCVCMFGVDELHLLNIAVASRWHRQGVARWMLDRLVELCQAHHLQAIWLEVRPSNTGARALYTAQGYQDISLRKHYYPDVGGREDALVMKQEVPDATLD